MAEAGARVLAVARSEDRLRSLAREAVGEVEPVVADVTVGQDRQRVLDLAGDLDALVNNAGAATVAPVAETAVDDVARLLELNVIAVIELCRLALPGMLARRRGHIVNVGSVLGYTASPDLAVYSATKSAVEGFSEGLRREVLGRGVDVTLVTPGAVRVTEVLDRAGGVAEGSPLDVGFDLAGIEPGRVAEAVRSALVHPWWPAGGSRSVPRAFGLSRLADVPGVDRVLDAGSRLVRSRSGRLG